MFGLVTRRELGKILDERDKALARDREEMAFEWSRWFDKFRSLYAQWTNRDKKAAKVDPGGATDGELDTDDHHPPKPDPRQLAIPFRSRRQF